jgi:tetratricopeptide (TPR) repeat protein
MDVARLERSLDWALRNELPHAELVRMLRPLVRATVAMTEGGCRARLQLAEHLLLSHKTEDAKRAAWEALSLAKAVISHSTELEFIQRAQGAQGLACTLLGHFNAARRAYLRALAIDPADPVCAHNLGHLEVVLGAPARGLRWLRAAHRALPEDLEIAASLGHALVRLGRVSEARGVLQRVCRDACQVDGWLKSWAKP